MSGKLFQQGLYKAEPIIATQAVLIQKQIINKINNRYPNISCTGLGSVGKKKDNEYNGDIDIGVKVDSLDELNTIIKTTFGEETIISKSFYIVSILYKYNETKYVSVDFIQVVDLDYTKFRYYCPDYTKDESKYKVGTKIMLAGMLLNHCAEKNYNIPNGYYGKYDFSPIGLYRYIINTQNFSDYKHEFVTLNINTIISIPFKTINATYFNSVETLWDAIHSEDFKYPNELNNIEINFFVNSYRKCWEELVKLEDFGLSDDIIKIINNKIEHEKQIRALNLFFDKM